LGIIAILAFFLPQATVKEQIFQFFASYLPGSVDLIQENITRVISARGPLGIVGIAGLIWTGSQVFGGVNRVINQAWGIRQFRPFWFGKPRDIAMALSTGLLFFIAISSTTFDSIIPAVELPVVGALSGLLSRFVSFLVALAAFSMLYKFLPNTRTYWGRIWPGALFAAVIFEVARSLFIFFVTNFTNWSLVYGQIGSVIAFLIWVYVSTYILIVGAEFCAEFDRMRRGIKQDAKLCKIGGSN
jgi:membrane protein